MKTVRVKPKGAALGLDPSATYTLNADEFDSALWSKAGGEPKPPKPKPDESKSAEPKAAEPKGAKSKGAKS